MESGPPSHEPLQTTAYGTALWPARFDAWMKLAEFRLRRWHARRDVEWKMSIAFWGLLLSATTIQFRPPLLLAVVTIGVAVGLYARFWTWEIFVRNRDDQRVAFSYVERAEQQMSHMPFSRPREGPTAWAASFQLLASIVIATSVIYVIYARPMPTAAVGQVATQSSQATAAPLPQVEAPGPTSTISRWYVILTRRWPDFVVTFFGVFLAAWLSYRIERGRDARARKDRERHERHHLLAYVQRVARETRDNEQWVNKILSRLQKAIEIERAGGWVGSAIGHALDWAKDQAEALSAAAYDDLARSGLQAFLPDGLQDDLFESRQRVVDAKATLRAGPASLQMAYRLSEPLETVPQNILVILGNAAAILTRVKEPVHKYAASLALEFRTSGRR